MVRHRDKYSVEEEYGSHKTLQQINLVQWEKTKKAPPKQKLCWRYDLYVSKRATDMNVNESSLPGGKKNMSYGTLVGAMLKKIQKGLCDYSIDKRSKNGKR